MGQQGFLINTEDCIGCKACELACKDLHSFDIGPRTRRVYEAVSYTHLDVYKRQIQYSPRY